MNADLTAANVYPKLAIEGRCEMYPVERERATTAVLRFSEYFTRLTQINIAIRFALGALRRHESALCENPTVASAIERIKEGFYLIAQSVADEPVSRQDVDAATEPDVEKFKTAFLSGEPAREILLNLGLVLLCTQLELFINHLVGVVLEVEPRRFMDLASDKKMTAKEIVKLGGYGRVLQFLRDKVIDEIDREGTRGKFVEQLGERLGLIRVDEIMIAPKFEGVPVPPDAFKEWDLDRLVEVFEQRHGIVHRGESPVKDRVYLDKVGLFFGAIQTVLTVNAVRKYNVKLDPPDSVGTVLFFGKHVCGLTAHVLDEFETTVSTMFRADQLVRPNG